MAPIKFEENIREKLEERELQPKKESWDQLATALDKESPSRNNKFVWYAVAASIAGVLLVLTIVFNSGGIENSNELVEENIIEKTEFELPEIVPTQKEEITENKEVIAEETYVEEESVQGQEIAVTEETKESAIKQKLEEIIEVRKEEIEVANEIIEPEKELKVEKTNEDLFIDKKVQEVVASVQEIQNNNNTVTAEEIDALLAKANREIANQKILSSSSYKVDAAALLSDVESELERSFRDKVFDALGDGFNKVRTAVTERNN